MKKSARGVGWTVKDDRGANVIIQLREVFVGGGEIKERVIPNIGFPGFRRPPAHELNGIRGHTSLRQGGGATGTKQVSRPIGAEDCFKTIHEPGSSSGLTVFSDEPVRRIAESVPACGILVSEIEWAGRGVRTSTQNYPGSFREPVALMVREMVFDVGRVG